jgi:uncharacterized membrane-anchored protein
MLSKLILVGIVAIAQVGFLGGMIVVDSLPYMLGETVRLKVMPVDPRDMFRGDYSILSYDFTSVGQSKITGLQRDNDYYWADAARDVYIKLEKNPESDVWTTKEITITRPSSGTYLQGVLNGWRIDCGIEAYFVQEGQGRRIDEAVRGGKQVEAEVAVWQGKAKLKQVLVK